MNMMSTNLILIVVLIGVMYFVMIRPQQKQDKKNKEMRESLKIGDEIVTIGGLVGKITKITEKTITIQTGNPNTKVELIKGAVANISKKDNTKKEEEHKEQHHDDAAEATASRDKKVTPKKLTKKGE